jgi:hypothetical protein
MILLVLTLSSACEVGQVPEGEGCKDICYQKYFNPLKNQCEDYNSCESWEYLNLTSNTCHSTCPNGYYLNGTCTCYAGFKLSSETCEYDEQSERTKDSALGLDWFIWGLVVILSINLLYLIVSCCYYKRKQKKVYSNGLQV